MNGLGFLDRLQTIAATATVTSAVWIVAGTVYLDRDMARAPDAPVEAAQVRATTRATNEPRLRRLMIPVSRVAAADLYDTFAESRGDRRHEAIDIMAPAGTPVVAAAGGKVEKLFRSDDGGNTIYIRSPDRRTIHYYAHLRDYAPGLAEGLTVERGARLGTVGSTGNADSAAPHLHFAVLEIDPAAPWYETGSAINPYPLLVPD